MLGVYGSCDGQGKGKGQGNEGSQWNIVNSPQDKFRRESVCVCAHVRLDV